MEKNDAGLRFAFGVTAMTTDRKASNRSRTSSGRLRALNSGIISLSYYCVDTFRGKKNHIENEKKGYYVSLLRGRISWCCNISAKLKGNSHLSTLTLIQ